MAKYRFARRRRTRSRRKRLRQQGQALLAHAFFRDEHGDGRFLRDRVADASEEALHAALTAAAHDDEVAALVLRTVHDEVGRRPGISAARAVPAAAEPEENRRMTCTSTTSAAGFDWAISRMTSKARCDGALPS